MGVLGMKAYSKKYSFTQNIGVMLKHFIVCLGFVALWTSSVSAEYVKVVHPDGVEDIRGIDLKTMKVCELKQRIARLLSLKIREFDLIGGGNKLKPGKTLKDDRVFNGKRLTVKPAKSSYQCR